MGLTPTPTTVERVVVNPPPIPVATRRVIDEGQESFSDLASARAKFDSLAEELEAGERRLHLTIAWRIVDVEKGVNES
jgi:hypothetical protein